MIKPNKEQEINKALQEIKEKKGTTSEQSKKGAIPKPKNKKNVKLVNEPLFKDNKRKEHTIIHNRNASAINNENRGKNNKEDDGQVKNKKKKESSMRKFARKNIINANNIELKYNLKRIKKDNIKEKEKDKNINKDNKDKNNNKKGEEKEKEKEKERKNNSSEKKKYKYDKKK